MKQEEELNSLVLLILTNLLFILFVCVCVRLTHHKTSLENRLRKLSVKLSFKYRNHKKEIII